MLIFHFLKVKFHSFPRIFILNQLCPQYVIGLIYLLNCHLISLFPLLIQQICFLDVLFHF